MDNIVTFLFFENKTGGIIIRQKMFVFLMMGVRTIVFLNKTYHASGGSCNALFYLFFIIQTIVVPRAIRWMDERRNHLLVGPQQQFI